MVCLRVLRRLLRLKWWNSKGEGDEDREEDYDKMISWVEIN